MGELTLKEMKQVDEALQSHINKLPKVLNHGQITEKNERHMILNYLEEARSAQEKIQHYTNMGGF